MNNSRSIFSAQLELVPRVIAGLVIGSLGITISVSFATMMFSGNLSPFLPQGIGIMLFGAAILSAGIALTSTLPGMIAGPEEVAAAILTTIGMAVVAQARTAEEAFFTFIVIIAATAVLTGVMLWLLGHFRLGRLVRFVPYPVIGGFLAGAGWLLIQGALTMMMNAPVHFNTLGVLLHPDLLPNWLPGVLFSVVLFFVLNKFSHFLLLPGMVLVSALLFFIVLWVHPITIEDASARGWLLGALPSGGLWKPLTAATITSANLHIILSQAPNIIAVATLTVITLLLCITGIEIALNRETDLDPELRSAGLVNIVSGVFGGFSGCHIISDTNLAHQMGASRRSTGLIVSGLCLLTLILGGKVLAYFPRCILGGLLIYQGLELLHEWVVAAARKLPRHDYGVALVILAVIATVGFLEGVAVGLTITLILFVFNYSKIDFIKHTHTGTNHRSNVDRSPAHNRILEADGRQTYMLILRGYIFFGTANNLLEHIKERIRNLEVSPIKYLILDFRQVTGIDSSAVFSFTKLMQTLEREGITLLFTQLSLDVNTLLAQHGFFSEHSSSMHVFADLDHGLEWCENELLQSRGLCLETAEITIQLQLGEMLGTAAHVDEIVRSMERIEIPAGQEMIKQGSMSDEIFFVESGHVTTELDMNNGQKLRLRKMGPGAIIGEIGFYLHIPRTASVVAQTNCVVYSLSSNTLNDLTNKYPAASAAFHNYMVHMQSERLMNINTLVKELEG